VLAGWIGLSAVVWGVYLWGFTSPGGHPSLLALLARPGEAIRFFLALLGNPVGAFVRPQDAIAQTAVPALGAAGLALFGWILLRGDRRRFLDSRRAVWIGLAAHALLSAAAITLARVGFGLAAAFPTRYITFFWPFWLGTLALLTVDQVRPGVRVPPGAGPAAGWPLAQAAWAALIVMCLVTYNTHVQRWRPFSRDIQAAVFELPDVCQGNAVLIGRIAAPDAVAEGLPVLMRHGLLRLAPQAFAAPAPVRQEEPPGAIESVRLESGSGFTHSGPCLRIAGHLSRRAARGTEVLLVGANQVLKRGGVGPLRPRTGPDFDQDPDPETGWVLYIGTERMPQGLDRLDVYTVLPDRQAVRIGTVEFPLKLDPGAQFRISQAGPGPSSIAPEPTYAVEPQERAGPSK
jgi:hypothetical protein